MKIAIFTAAAALALGAAALAQTPAPRPAPGAAGIMAMTDANKDGVITKAEAVAAKWSDAEFAHGDANKDGKITLEELTAAMVRAGEKP